MGPDNIDYVKNSNFMRVRADSWNFEGLVPVHLRVVFEAK